jgi:hypothetical protein
LAAPVLRAVLQRDGQAEIDRITAGSTRLKRLAWDVIMERELRDKRTKEAMDIYFDYGPRPAVPRRSSSRFCASSSADSCERLVLRRIFPARSIEISRMGSLMFVRVRPFGPQWSHRAMAMP